MQKNPINEGDSIQEPMTLQAYEDAVSLPDGIYPITNDAGTVLDASLIAYGNRTVEDALDDIRHIEFIADVSTTAQTYTRDPKYKEYMVSIDVSGYQENKYVPTTSSYLSHTMYASGSNYLFLEVDLRATSLKYSVAGGTGTFTTNIRSVKLYGIY